MKLNRVRAGSTLYIFDDASAEQVEQEIVKELRNGETIQRLGVDGIERSREWIAEEVVFDSTKFGSDAYTWDRSGEQVKVRRFLCVQTGAGVCTRKELRPVYKSFSEAVG